MTATKEIEWTLTKLDALKAVMEETEGDVFLFEGHEFMKQYAKYLVEYLESIRSSEGDGFTVRSRGGVA